MKLASKHLLIFSLFLISSVQAAEQPNFLVIVADDMGWSDISPFGGEIRTPTLQQLADNGLSMSQFYVAPTCAPTRAMLMTGLDNHRAGVGTQRLNAAPNQIGYRHYEGQLLPEVVTVAEALTPQGYHSVMAGKWHLANDEAQRPHNRGFVRSFSLLEGAAGHFGDKQPLYRTLLPTYLEDGIEVDLPADFYSTISYTDKIIEYIDDAPGDAPFFAYLAYTAPHDPLQVPQEWEDRYAGVYDVGPEVIREQRIARQIELGLINDRPQLWNPPEYPSWLPLHKAPWDERSAEERAVEIRRMEIYAAMIELMDSEIGRLIDHLDSTGRLDNTHILFFSDNGANSLTPLFYPTNTREFLFEELDNSFENMGKTNSHTSQGLEWAVVSSTPNKLYKSTTAEGGIRSPFIVSGPGIEPGRSSQIGHVMDIAPTIYALAGVDTQDDVFAGKIAPEGVSIASLWRGESQPARTLIMEMFGRRVVREADWKAVIMPPPFGNGAWQLYNLAEDPTELNNLSSEEAERLASMVSSYEEWAEDQQVILPIGRRRITTDMFYDAPCNWYCMAKFKLYEWIR